MEKIEDVLIERFIDGLYIIKYKSGYKIVVTKDVSRRNHLDVKVINVVYENSCIKEQYYYVMDYLDFLTIYN
jgi:hypothetical protein